VKEQLQRVGVEWFRPNSPLAFTLDEAISDALHAAMVEDVERLKPPPTSSMSNAHGHFIERCGCGIVLAQCRCPGPKDERVSNNPCSHVSVQEARDGK